MTFFTVSDLDVMGHQQFSFWLVETLLIVSLAVARVIAGAQMLSACISAGFSYRSPWHLGHRRPPTMNRTAKMRIADVAERHVASRKCRECHRERTRRYRAADPERARERERRWRAANLELARKGDRERKRLHYAKNKDRILSERAVKRAANPEKAREYQRRWWAANKGKIKAAQREAARAAPPRPHQPPTESVP